MATRKKSPEAETAATPAVRTKAGQFAPGVSGNPSGRARVVGHIRDLARLHGEAAIEKLVELMNGEDPRVARAAATDLLDRGYGKPSQPVGGADDLPPLRSERELTNEQLEAIARGAVDG